MFYSSLTIPTLPVYFQFSKSYCGSESYRVVRYNVECDSVNGAPILTQENEQCLLKRVEACFRIKSRMVYT